MHMYGLYAWIQMRAPMHVYVSIKKHENKFTFHDLEANVLLEFDIIDPLLKSFLRLEKKIIFFISPT